MQEIIILKKKNNNNNDNDIDSEKWFNVIGMITICFWHHTSNRSKGNFMLAWLSTFVCDCKTVDHLYCSHLGEWLSNNNASIPAWIHHSLYLHISLSPATFPLFNFTQMWQWASHTVCVHAHTHTQIHCVLVMSLLSSDWDHRFVASGLSSVCMEALSCLALVICRFPDTSRVDLASILFSLEESIWCLALVRR